MLAESPPALLESLAARVTALLEDARAFERAHGEHVGEVPEAVRAGARNLLHYVALRRHDVRGLQGELTVLGLSSLGRMEPNVLASLDAVRTALHALAGMPAPPEGEPDIPCDHHAGPAALERATAALLGPAPADRAVRIMVTMPSEAAVDGALLERLLAAGMDVMRINSAHDGPEAWLGMVENLAAARRATGRACRVMVDLAGPKLRTGALPTEPGVLRVKPVRDRLGRAAAPARLWLTPAQAPEAPSWDGARAGGVLPAPAALVEACEPGDQLTFTDARRRPRALDVVASAGRRSRWLEGWAGAYLPEGTTLRLERGGRVLAQGPLGPLPRQPVRVRVEAGRPLRVVREGAPVALAGPVPAIPCSLPEIFAEVRAGERIAFDDGKASGTVLEAGPDGLLVDVQQAPQGGLWLGPDKGINLPDSVLSLPALTADDRLALDFAARHADLVGLSFVRTPEDVLLLESECDRRDAQHLGVVLKIETQQGFANLPRLLLTGLRSPPLGVMVARGDLAVELGFERLAEVQEQILWLCEAAHVPVIWATQVLETLAKKGQPSRAEVTDAAMSARAECVMLNKGPHVAEAVRFLDDVLRRMAGHQQKKRAMLRPLATPQA